MLAMAWVATELAAVVAGIGAIVTLVTGLAWIAWPLMLVLSAHALIARHEESTG